MAILPFLANLKNGAGYWSVFAVLFVFGWISGVVQASVFSMAGGLPFKYMAALMLGQGVAGISSNIMRALTLYFWPFS